MTVYLYLDELFFINFMMDFLVLCIVARMMKYQRRWGRIVLGGVLGALWAVFAAICPEIWLWLEYLVTYGVVSTVMVKVSFGVKGMRRTGGAVAALYAATLVLAGVVEFLYQHTMAGTYLELILHGEVRQALPFYRLLLFAAGAYFGVRYLFRWLLETVGERNHFYEVTMHYRGKEKIVTALLDTGNRLYEPITRQPVHVVTYDAVKDLCESVSSVIFIPFGSVGKNQGMLPGVFLDEMEIRQGNEVRVVKKPLVAICRKSLAAGGEYQMLLHEE